MNLSADGDWGYLADEGRCGCFWLVFRLRTRRGMIGLFVHVESPVALWLDGVDPTWPSVVDLVGGRRGLDSDRSEMAHGAGRIRGCGV